MVYFSPFVIAISDMSYYLIKSVKLWKERGGAFYINDCLSMSHDIKRNRKDQELQFLSQLVLSFSHIDKHVLTSHTDEVVKLLFFEIGNIAVSEAQIASLIFFYCLSLPYQSNHMRCREGQIELKKYKCRNTLGENHRILGCTPPPRVIFCYFFVNFSLLLE